MSLREVLRAVIIVMFTVFIIWSLPPHPRAALVETQQRLILAQDDLIQAQKRELAELRGGR